MNRMAQEVPLSDVINSEDIEYILIEDTPEDRGYAILTRKDIILLSGRDILRFTNPTSLQIKKGKIYIPPEYIAIAKDSFLKLTLEQQNRVLSLFLRQFAVKDIKLRINTPITASIGRYDRPDQQLNSIISYLMRDIHNSLRRLWMGEADEMVGIDLYLEVWKNLESIIMGIRSGTIRGGYRRKLKQTRKNKRGAKKSRKRSM